MQPEELGKQAARLVCRANPPVWSCRVASLPVQGDERVRHVRKEERGRNLRGVWQTPKESLVGKRAIFYIISVVAQVGQGRVKRILKKKSGDFRCSCTMWGRLWRASPPRCVT